MDGGQIMKRLTMEIVPGGKYLLSGYDGYTMTEAINKLGRYEDTGLEPEEIGKMDSSLLKEQKLIMKQEDVNEK